MGRDGTISVTIQQVTFLELTWCIGQPSYMCWAAQVDLFSLLALFIRGGENADQTRDEPDYAGHDAIQASSASA